MSKPILAVLGHFTEEVEARLARDYTVRRVSTDARAGSAATSAATSSGSSAASSTAARTEGLLLAAEGADAIFFNPPAKLDGEFFRRVAASVKVIATFSVGYDHIDVGAAAARGIAIANTPGVLDDATADVAILLLLGASRRAYEAQEMVRSGGVGETWRGASAGMGLRGESAGDFRDGEDRAGGGAAGAGVGDEDTLFESEAAGARSWKGTRCITLRRRICCG